MSGEVNFLSLRSELEHWTLESDQKLFTAIKAMSDKIIATEGELQTSFQKTKSSLVENKVNATNNFNQFLRLSQFKFTENKIAQSDKTTRNQQNQKQQKKQKQAKPKMDIFKEAIKLSISNLQINQQEKQTDNISVSEISLSQAIFKSTKIPALYGTQQYRKTKFLNLFFDEELVQSRRTFYKKEQFPQSQPTSPNTEVTMKKAESTIKQEYSSSNVNLPPPPPPLSDVLGGKSGSQSIIPAAPNLSNLPPIPPMTLSLPPLTNISSSSISLPPPPPPPSLNLVPPPLSSPLNLAQSLAQNLSSGATSQIPNEVPPPVKIKRSLTIQQQLALRLKQGKNYKPPPVQAPQPQIKHDAKLAVIRESVQSEQKLSEEPYRASKNIDQILRQSGNPFQKKQENIFDAEQQQDENSIFGPSKTRIKEKLMNKQTPVGIKMDNTSRLKEPQIKQEQNIMSRQTFNEDVLIKKAEPVVEKPKQIIPNQNKENPKKDGIFGSEDQDEDPFSNLKKRNTNILKSEVKKPAIAKQKQKNNKLFEDDQQDDFLANKKSRTQTMTPNFQKKPMPLQATDSKIPEVVIEKNQEQQVTREQIPSKPKKEDPLKSSPIKQSPISLPTVSKVTNPKAGKKSLFDDQQDDEGFISKVTAKKTQKKEEKIVISTGIVKQQKRQKEVAKDIGIESIANSIKLKEENLKNTQQSATNSVKRMAALGGQAMMPMMLPGMNITKPSQAKKQQQEAMRRMKQQKMKQQQEQRIRLQQEAAKKLLQQQQARQMAYNAKVQEQPNEVQSQQLKNNQIEDVLIIPPTQINQENEKQNLEQVHIQQTAVITNQQSLFLATRKKKKPSKVNLNFDQEETKNIPKTTIQPPKQLKVEIIQQKIKDTESIKSPLNLNPEPQRASIKFSERIGVSILPVMPNNLTITKPSQAKRLQRQAQQRQQMQIQKQMQQKLFQQEQQRQRQMYIQNERIRQQQQQKIRQEERMRIEDQRRRNFEYQKQIQRQQQQQAIKAQRAKLEEQKRAIETERRRIQQQRQRQKRRQIEQNEQRKRLAQEERNRKPLLPQFQKMPQQRTTTGPIGFAPKLPSRNPMGVMGGESIKPAINPLPVLPKVGISTQKTSKKGGLFDGSDQQEPAYTKKEQPKKNIVEKKKGGLFGDEQQQDFSIKPKTTQPAVSKKKGLFDDDDNDGDFFKPTTVKPKLSSNPPESSFKQTKQPTGLSTGLNMNTGLNAGLKTGLNAGLSSGLNTGPASLSENKVQPKPLAKKKSPFESDQEENQVKQVTVQKKQPVSIANQMPVQESTFTNRNYFQDSDDQDAEALRKKRIAAKKMKGAF